MAERIYIIGIGMGNPDTLTVEARRAIGDCRALVGAPRLLEPYPEKSCTPLIEAGAIAQFVRAWEDGPVGVLLSGDVGFYSGAKNLWPLLEGLEVVTLPGISSLSYFCAKLHIPWQEVYAASVHGRDNRVVGEIQRHGRTFLLTGGQNRAEEVCRALVQRGLGDLQVHVGERLSYPEERIQSGPAAQMAEQSFDELSVLLVENPHPIWREASVPCLPDRAFQRGKVPMTKEEIRALALCKLTPRPDDVIWDVGAGTGSVSVECALAAPAGRVFAVEHSPEALPLLEANRARHGVANLIVVPGRAPEVLEGLPPPQRVFLGGTSGEMEAILRHIFFKNPAVRVVASAITLETLSQCLDCCARMGLAADFVQISVTRTRALGRYHMPDPLNPVWLVTMEASHG